MKYIITILFIHLLLLSHGITKETITHLTIKDGLSQSSVKSLIQDYQGFIWVGTSDGLNKFDGKKFTIFRIDPLSPQSIEGNDISCLYENPFDSTLYIGTQDAGLNIYNRDLNNFISFQNNPKYINITPPSHIKDIISTNDSTVWLATKRQGLYYFNSKDSVFFNPKFNQQFALLQINCLEKDQDKNLWIGTNKGLYKLKEKDYWSKRSHPEKINSTNISTLKIDIKGNLWIGTKNNGLLKYQPHTQDLKTLTIPWKDKTDSSYIINRIIQSRNKDIWIGTNKGLIKINEERDEIKIYQKNRSDPESLNNNDIYSLLEDREGILWIGTHIGGINLLNPFRQRFSKFTNFSELINEDAINIHSIHVDNNSHTWLGTDKGLLEITPSTNIASSFRKDNVIIHFKNKYIGAITSTKKDLLISSNGIKLINLKNKTVTDLTSQIKKQIGTVINNFSSSIIDDNDNIWLTTPKGLLFFTPSSMKFQLYNPVGTEGETMQISFSTIAEDFYGKYWIGTYNGKLYTFDIYTKKFNHSTFPQKERDKVKPTKIFSICKSEISPGQIFIGTNLGLYQINTLTHDVKRYLENNGLPNNIIYSVISDSEGKIWCSTNAGLSCFNPLKNSFHNYTYEDGLQSNEFTEGSSFKDKDGLIYFGGIDGLNIFNPLDIKMNKIIPSVIISKMEIQYQQITPENFPKILQKQISESKKIILNYPINTFSFEFSSLSYSLYNRNQYQFSLTKAGNKDRWINSENRGFAAFTNINPGRYFFKVKGSNSDGIWNKNPTVLEIIIKSPFWKSWWFMSLAAIIIISSVLLLIWVKEKNNKKQKETLQTIVKNKTNRLKEQTRHIKIQNRKLQKINKNIRKKNKQLKNQHIQITKQKNRLLHLAEKAEEATQAKLHLFTNISHELRTPLTLIIDPLNELIKNLKSTTIDELKRKLINIHVSSSKLLNTINQLLDFRKAETGNMEMRISKIDIIQFSQKTASLFNDLSKKKNFHFTIQSTLPKLLLWVDPNKLESILFNLLQNAFKFTPKNGYITLNISLTKRDNKTFASISIKDTGIGIEKEKIHHIFDQFSQIEQSDIPIQSGSGLGLALVSKYVKMHHGYILVNSTFGIGSEFNVILPLGKKHFKDNVQITSTNNPLQTELLKTTLTEYQPIQQIDKNEFIFEKEHTIIIIEDNKALRTYTKEALIQQYNIEEASTIKEGYKLLNTKNIDLIVCDILLPDGNGLDFCKKIKSEFKSNHLPVIMLTSLADQRSKIESLKSGADDFITKPFDIQYLNLSINNLIEGRIKLRKKFSITNPTVYTVNLKNKKDKEFINKATECVEQNIENTMFNAEDFSKQLQMSQSQLYRKIKTMTGLNISEFIRNTRLKKAAHLLQTSNLKINEVAYETGFNDPNYFTKCFTKLYGLAPTIYSQSFKRTK